MTKRSKTCGAAPAASYWSAQSWNRCGAILFGPCCLVIDTPRNSRRRASRLIYAGLSIGCGVAASGKASLLLSVIRLTRHTWTCRRPTD
jgi:hypothetical protein